MRRKIMAVLLGTIICATGTACGSAKEDTTTEIVAEETAPDKAADISNPSENDSEVETADSETAEGETGEASDEEGKYLVFTDASNAEVEGYAQKVVDTVLAKDWETIGDMIEYPIGTEEANNLCNNKEEFLAYANSTGFSDEEISSLTSWNISDLWANYQGACIADGSIWFRDMDVEKKDLKIVSLFGLREPGGEITD